MKRIIQFLIIFFVCDACCLAGGSPPLEGIKILLDPGHGVKNTRGVNINRGMNANGLKEQFVVVDVAEILGRKLQKAGCKVYYTRDKKQFWRINNDVDEDNYNRAFEAEGYNVDAFIRLHFDWNRRKYVSGTRTYYLKRKSEKLAKDIQSELVKTIRRKDRGIKQEWFKGLEETTMPSVLVEICFISNPREAELMKKEDFLEDCAEGIYNGLLKYFNKNTFAGRLME